VVWSASQKPPPHYRSSPTKTEQKENQPPKTVINSGTQKDSESFRATPSCVNVNWS
jgi:hypothetical protein